MNFVPVAGRRGAVVEDDFYNKLESSMYKQEKSLQTGQDSVGACATHL